jgi:uncharacterized membrane protein (DUF485 family)
VAAVSDSDYGPELAALARRRWRIAVILSAAMFVAYFGFILVVAFAKDRAGSIIGGNISFGIALGAGAIVVAPILTAIYVRWANRRYDAAVQKLREGRS